jgi:hypothetical protein
VPGNQQEDFMLNLLFPNENWPKNRSGTVLFQIENVDEPLAVKVQLGSSLS